MTYFVYLISGRFNINAFQNFLADNQHLNRKEVERHLSFFGIICRSASAAVVLLGRFWLLRGKQNKMTLLSDPLITWKIVPWCALIQNVQLSATDTMKNWKCGERSAGFDNSMSAESYKLCRYKKIKVKFICLFWHNNSEIWNNRNLLNYIEKYYIV